jgi:prepilin-type N-terminal cleavage/methylation domain-containing protein
VSGKRGFTIMEILIAISILLVGIVGVISLFPVAIRVGGEAITDSLAANLARSVEEGIRAAVKNRKVAYTLPGDRMHLLAYFIYENDGVYDPAAYGREKVRRDFVPAEAAAVRRGEIRDAPYGSAWGLDSVILLPCDNSKSAEMGIGYRGASVQEARRKAYLGGKVFVYPEGDPEESPNARAEPNGRGNPQAADDDKDDFRVDSPDQEYVREWEAKLLPDEEWPLRVTRTYRFGTRVNPEAESGPQGTNTTLYTIAPEQPGKEEDPYANYSYALAIRRAFEDGNLSVGTRSYAPANELFEVKVMVFKAFAKDTKHADPVYTASFLISR